MLADDLTGKTLEGIVVHEVTHTMRQNSFAPYVEFIRTADKFMVPGDPLDAYLNHRPNIADTTGLSIRTAKNSLLTRT